MIEEIVIDIETYNRLLQNSEFLEHLLANGVSNWEGYSRPPEEDPEYYVSEYDC